MPTEAEVLFVGDANHGEFAMALEWLRKQARLTVQPTVQTALRGIQDEGEQPPAIVLGQARRGEHTAVELDLLLRAAPLANTIALVGSWCEGETRSGSPPAGWTRVYWHQFASRAKVELFPGASLDRTSSPPLYHPRTTTETERGLARSLRPLTSRQGVIAISTPYSVDYEATALVCRETGYQTHWCQGAEVIDLADVDAVIWDRWGLQGEERTELARWRRRWPELPLVATIGFPRPQDYQLVATGLVQQIVGKPFVLAELLQALKEVMALSRDAGKAA